MVVYSFDKYLLSAYYMLGIILAPQHEQNSKGLCLWRSWGSSQGRWAGNKHVGKMKGMAIKWDTEWGRTENSILNRVHAAHLQ